VTRKFTTGGLLIVTELMTMFSSPPEACAEAALAGEPPLPPPPPPPHPDSAMARIAEATMAIRRDADLFLLLITLFIKDNFASPH
jgi:hypothetical protein